MLNKDLQDIVSLGDRICDGLERLSNADKNFNTEVGFILEKLNWEMLKLRNEIQCAGEHHYVYPL